MDGSLLSVFLLYWAWLLQQRENGDEDVSHVVTDLDFSSSHVVYQNKH